MNSKESTEDGIGQLRVMVRKLYDKVPLRFRWIASPLTYCDRLLFDLRPKLWILSGNERISNMPVSILYAVNDLNADRIRNKNYMLGLIFGDSFHENYIGQTWLWKISKIAEDQGQNCSFVIVQVHESHRKLLRSSKWFYIPNWVSGKVEIPNDPSVTKDSSLKSDLRRIRKHSLHYEVTRNQKRFDDFYYNMYIPHITKVHGISANIMSYDYMRAEFQKCELLLVKKQEKRIAGILIAYEEVPRLWSLGVRDSNPEYIRDGAVGALFYYSLLYLKEIGYTTITFGMSRAFLRDGVLRYKKKWSQKIVGKTSYGYALKVLTYTDPAKAFLQENPFIFDNHEDLQGAVFVNADKSLSSEKLQKIDEKYFHDGLTKLYIYCFQDVEGIEKDSIPLELSDRIVLRTAGDMA